MSKILTKCADCGGPALVSAAEFVSGYPPQCRSCEEEHAAQADAQRCERENDRPPRALNVTEPPGPEE